MMNFKKQYVISIPYMHPVCPISLSHARIFLVADIIGRYKEIEGFDVYMPIGIHYSGKEIMDIFDKLQSFTKTLKQKNIKKYSIPWLFLNYYKIDLHDLRNLKTPISILKFFSNQQINNLKELKAKFNFSNFYNTKNKEYEKFVKKVFRKYEEKDIIIKTEEGKAINFNKKGWKNLALKRLDKIKVIGKGGRKILENSILRLDDKWSFERINGIGVKINGKIINPMFDSQLYTQFESKRFKFKMPVDLFIAETHLSTWLASKIMIETLMLRRSEITKSYFLLGLAFTKDHKKMSSSKGTSILLPDLLERWGVDTTRISIILAGHPNKDFFWNNNILMDTKKIIRKFKNFEIEISNFDKNSNKKISKVIKRNKEIIKENIERGDLRKACIIGLITFPYEIRRLKLNKGGQQIQKHINYIKNIFLPER